jgi:hypothetical protein
LASRKYLREVKVLIFPSLPKILMGLFNSKCGKPRAVKTF